MAAATQLKLMLHDRVVADGRVGVVVGFYHCTEEESVLVSFSLYDAAKYRVSDVELLIGSRVGLPHPGETRKSFSADTKDNTEIAAAISRMPKRSLLNGLGSSEPFKYLPPNKEQPA